MLQVLFDIRTNSLDERIWLRSSNLPRNTERCRFTAVCTQIPVPVKRSNLMTGCHPCSKTAPAYLVTYNRNCELQHS